MLSLIRCSLTWELIIRGSMVHLQTGFDLVSSDLLKRVRCHLVRYSSNMMVVTIESVAVVLVSIARIICKVALRCRQHD